MSELTVEQITNHIEQALARLAGKLTGQERMEALVTVLVTEIQTLETTFFQLMNQRSLTDDFTGESAIGAQLDGIGTIIGLSRYTSQTDDSYRLDLKAWVRFLLSQGEGNTLAFVLKALTDSTDVHLTEHFPASVILSFDGTVLNSDNLSSIMNQCAAGGVRVDLVQAPSGCFRFDSGPGYDVGTYAQTLTEH